MGKKCTHLAGCSKQALFGMPGSKKREVREPLLSSLLTTLLLLPCIHARSCTRVPLSAVAL